MTTALNLNDREVTNTVWTLTSMRYIKYFVGLAVLTAITACSHSSPDQSRYMKYAATIPPVNVPADIKNPTGDSYYPIPPVAFTAPIGTQPPLVPPGATLVSQKSKAQLPVPR